MIISHLFRIWSSSWRRRIGGYWDRWKALTLDLAGLGRVCCDKRNRDLKRRVFREVINLSRAQRQCRRRNLQRGLRFLLEHLLLRRRRREGSEAVRMDVFSRKSQWRRFIRRLFRPVRWRLATTAAADGFRRLRGLALVVHRWQARTGGGRGEEEGGGAVKAAWTMRMAKVMKRVNRVDEKTLSSWAIVDRSRRWRLTSWRQGLRHLLTRRNEEELAKVEVGRAPRTSSSAKRSSRGRSGLLRWQKAALRHSLTRWMTPLQFKSFSCTRERRGCGNWSFGATRSLDSPRSCWRGLTIV
jgi:hypothetical protein